MTSWRNPKVALDNDKSSRVVLSMYRPKTAGEKQVLLALLATSVLILLALAVFYALNPREVIGDALVNNAAGSPEEVPPPGTFPFYVKPVTIFFTALVVFSYCFFVLVRSRIEKVPRGVLTLLLVLSVLALAVSTYETLFNFALWGSLMVSQGNPDLIVNSYPVNSEKVNLVFATKSFVALLFVSYFSLATIKDSLGSEST